tara:strand:+ start:2033 stop:2797 length:765 start_codon:yes stop_codon:yes gene_type:complete
MNLPSQKRLQQRWIKLAHQPNITQLTCKVCDYCENIKKYKKLIAKDNFGAGQLIRYKCPNCGVIFGDLRFLNLSKDEINKDYQDHYSFHSEGDTSITIIKMFQLLNLQKNISYLDYACGESKKSLEFLNNKGYNVYGYDKYVKSNYKNFLTNIDNKKFDIIYSNNFIEHIIDPIENLTHILEHLNSDGKLILLSPCWSFAYCYEWTHYHTFFFSEKSLDILCKKLNIEQIASHKVNNMIGKATIYIKIFVKRIY